MGQRCSRRRRSHIISVAVRRQRPPESGRESRARAQLPNIYLPSPGPLPAAREPSDRECNNHQQDHCQDAPEAQHAAGAKGCRDRGVWPDDLLPVSSVSWIVIGFHVAPKWTSRFNHWGSARCGWPKEEERVEKPGAILENEVDPLWERIPA